MGDANVIEVVMREGRADESGVHEVAVLRHLASWESWERTPSKLRESVAVGGLDLRIGARVEAFQAEHGQVAAVALAIKIAVVVARALPKSDLTDDALELAADVERWLATGDESTMLPLRDRCDALFDRLPQGAPWHGAPAILDTCTCAFVDGEGEVAPSVRDAIRGLAIVDAATRERAAAEIVALFASAASADRRAA